MKKTLIVGNWKMYHNTHMASLLVHRLAERVKQYSDVEVVLCPNFLALQSISLQINHRQFSLGAQNCEWRDEGAYTGEVSAAMLHGVAKYVIVGHSERRHIFGERDRDIRNKVQAVLRNNMHPILCLGETAQQRADSETKQVIYDQLISGLANVTSDEIEDVVIAYEPVWAINTGDAAKPRDSETVAKFIRKQVGSLYGKAAAEKLHILYGGSVSTANAPQFLDGENIDGLLVGGASLDAVSFAEIVKQAHNKNKK